MVDIVLKKTNELSKSEKLGLVDLFNFIFDRNRTLEEFDNQYLENAIGYSYHVFMIEENRIVGSISGIPSYYLVHGERHIFVNGVDAMILKEYRDFFYYYDMFQAIHNFESEDGVKIDFNFPNDISNPILVKGRLAKSIGMLNTYCLPFNIGALNPKFKSLNFLSRTVSQFLILTAGTFSSSKIAAFQIEKDPETFHLSRYKRLDGDYNSEMIHDFIIYYKIMNYRGFKAAFLIDVTKKSARNFNQAIRFILKKHRNEIDIILYVGVLPFGCTGLVKVPHKMDPKTFNFSAIIMDKSWKYNSDVLNIDNWDVNLSNTDLI